MNISRRIPISKNLLLKISSLILGYLLWSTLSSSTMCNYAISIPVYCYNQADNMRIDAPESIHITLKAARTFMRLIDPTSLAVHIDAHSLHEGKNYITLSNKELLLPQEISVSHYTPLLITKE